MHRVFLIFFLVCTNAVRWLPGLTFTPSEDADERWRRDRYWALIARYSSMHDALRRTVLDGDALGYRAFLEGGVPYDLDLARYYADADELKVFIDDSDDSSEPGKVGLQEFRHLLHEDPVWDWRSCSDSDIAIQLEELREHYHYKQVYFVVSLIKAFKDLKTRGRRSRFSNFPREVYWCLIHSKLDEVTVSITDTINIEELEQPEPGDFLFDLANTKWDAAMVLRELVDDVEDPELLLIAEKFVFRLLSPVSLILQMDGSASTKYP